MPKVKNHIIQKKQDYLYVGINIILIIFCLILIGRVGFLGRTLALFFSFLIGDYSTIILAFILVYSISLFFLKRKIDFHHISFIGCVFIFIACLLFAHLGIYDALEMSNTNIMSKTLELYKHYLKNYNISYSCGGGIIGAALLQISCILISKIGTILLGIAFIIIGISYFTNVNIFRKFFKGGRLLKIPKSLIKDIKKYFSNIHYPSFSKQNRRFSIQSLEDYEEQVNFVLQNEINKEKLEKFKEFLNTKKIYAIADSFYTSYSSSRISIRLANRNDDELKAIVGFFNRKCFLLKMDNNYVIDYPNQFRKLLTLKSMLIEENNKMLPLAVDIDGRYINLDIGNGRLLVLTGDNSSGIKTLIRSMILSILIKNINYSDIYFYDFDHEFIQMNKADFLYVNNEKSASIALDEAFSEYERRSEVMKYFNSDSINDANAMIKRNNSDFSLIYPQFHFFYIDLNAISSTLLQKILYAIRFATRVGIIIIIVARDKQALSKLEMNKCDIVAFNMSDVATSIQLFGSDIACRLQKKGDVLIRKDKTLYHGQTPYVSIADFEKI